MSAYRSLGGRQHPYLSGLPPKRPPMIDWQPGFRLPLVHHLVQQRVLDFCPTMPSDMLSAERELDRPTGPDIHGELSQPAAHPAGEPDRDLPQGRAEIFLVEPAMNRLEPVQQQHVARAGTIAMLASRWGRCVLLYRELEKLELGHSAQCPRDPGVEKTHDCLEHPVGRVGVASMNPEDAPVEAEHHRTIGVRDDSINVS
jgi:hypothetical protein